MRIVDDALASLSRLVDVLPPTYNCLTLSQHISLLLTILRYSTMLQFLVGFALGNVVGMYVAQNYELPNIAKKIEAFKKDVEAKKKPPE